MRERSGVSEEDGKGSERGSARTRNTSSEAVLSLLWPKKNAPTDRNSFGSLSAALPPLTSSGGAVDRVFRRQHTRLTMSAALRHTSTDVFSRSVGMSCRSSWLIWLSSMNR